jgi:hypothetical protein
MQTVVVGSGRTICSALHLGEVLRGQQGKKKKKKEEKVVVHFCVLQAVIYCVDCADPVHWEESKCVLMEVMKVQEKVVSCVCSQTVL